MNTQTISLSVSEMVFDIQNKTYLTGRSREAADASTYEAAAGMQVSDDDDNLYQLHRSMASACGELRTGLAEFLSDDDPRTNNEIDVAIEGNAQVKIGVNLPSNYNMAAIGSVALAMHQFIVSRCISDWFMITNKAESDQYSAAAKQALEQVRRSIYKRVRPSREAAKPQQQQ